MNLKFPGIRRKDLIITIHGFGTKGKREMEPLCTYLKKEGYDPVSFDYFDPGDPGDTDVNKWISRCEEQVRQAVHKGRPVILIGFSMGGVIASYLASVFPVRMLILAAPAFYPFDFSKIEKTARSRVSSGSSSSAMSSAHTRAFMRLVTTYRESLRQVDCPILILHGTEDEVIQPSSSEKAFRMIGHDKAWLLYLHKGKHRFLYDGTHEALAFPIILDMIQGKFLSLQKSS